MPTIETILNEITNFHNITRIAKKCIYVSDNNLKIGYRIRYSKKFIYYDRATDTDHSSGKLKRPEADIILEFLWLHK